MKFSHEKCIQKLSFSSGGFMGGGGGGGGSARARVCTLVGCAPLLASVEKGAIEGQKSSHTFNQLMLRNASQH